MDKNEFLRQLKEALENDLNGAVVQENVRYYENYIAEEVRSGKTEAEVLEMLGDPWILARTIVDSPVNGGGDYVYEPETASGQGRNNSQKSTVKMHVTRIDSWWKKLLGIVVIVAVICMVVAVITGIISVIAPIVVPVLCVVFVIRLLGNRNRRM